jgi:O-methyltransferase
VLTTQPALQSAERLARAAVRSAGADRGLMEMWDFVPHREELGDLAAYRRRTRLWRALRANGFTMLSCRRARLLNRLAEEIERDGVPGAFVDLGVNNGGSSVMLSAGAPAREVYAFDSFEGLPDPGDLDGAMSAGWGGELVASEDNVRAAFTRWAHPERLHIVKGWFEDTFPDAVAEVGPVALMHADGDWYESVKLSLESWYDRVSPGGFVVIDDYGHWEGARRAVDEFRAGRGITTPMRKVDYSGVYWRKG